MFTEWSALWHVTGWIGPLRHKSFKVNCASMGFFIGGGDVPTSTNIETAVFSIGPSEMDGLECLRCTVNA